MIRFVYFDLGNVLVGFSHRRAAAQLARVCNVSKDRVVDELFDSGLQISWERGELDTFQVCESIRKTFGAVTTDGEIETAISDIFWPLAETIPLVASLAATGLPLGILSNTCDAHWKQVTTRTLRWIVDRFKTRILSFEVGTAKPDLAIYQRAIEQAGCRPNEVFFVDDRPENVAAARAAGIHAVQFDSAIQLACDLRLAGVQFSY